MARQPAKLPPLEAEDETAHRLIVELFKALPPPGADFPAPQRCAWLMAAAALFDLLHGFDPENPITILMAEKRRRH